MIQGETSVDHRAKFQVSNDTAMMNFRCTCLAKAQKKSQKGQRDRELERENNFPLFPSADSSSHLSDTRCRLPVHLYYYQRGVNKAMVLKIGAMTPVKWKWCSVSNMKLFHFSISSHQPVSAGICPNITSYHSHIESSWIWKCSYNFFTVYMYIAIRLTVYHVNQMHILRTQNIVVRLSCNRLCSFCK